MLKESLAIEFYMSEKDVEPGLPLICFIPGPMDAGLAAIQMELHFRRNFKEQGFARFKPDMFLNYREHRPSFEFDGENYQRYAPPQLKITIHEDEVGKKFLLLSGYEPDFNWDRFVAELRNVMRQLEVTDVYWFQSLPFPVPHTREVGVAVSGTRRELFERYSNWRPQDDVPVSLMSLMEYRLRHSGFQCSGFVFLTPHYVADIFVPQIPLRMLEVVAATAGLVIPSDKIRANLPEFFDRVEQRIARNPELKKIIGLLELGYDKGRFGPIRGNLRAQTEKMSADEIAEDLEQYLSDLTSFEDKNLGPSGGEPEGGQDEGPEGSAGKG